MPADAKARPDTAQDKEGQVVHVPQLLPARPEALSGLEAAFLTFLQASLLEPRQVAVSLPPGVPVERRIFLSLAESAQFSGLPAGYLRKLMAEGMVKAVRTGAGGTAGGNPDEGPASSRRAVRGAGTRPRNE
jgi:hypothetical protein